MVATSSPSESASRRNIEFTGIQRPNNSLLKLILSSGAVRNDRIWVCGSRDDPFSCESYDEDFNMKDEGYTLFPHSYSAMVHNQRGLTLLGGISPKEGRNDKVEHYQVKITP